MSYFVFYTPPAPTPPAPAPVVPLDYGNTQRLTFRAAIKRLSPPWLQVGRAGKVMYAFGKLLDDQTDYYVAGFKSRFPGLYSYDALALTGSDRRIRRGRIESDATYASRLAKWLDSHATRGGPYAMLGQLFAFFAPSNFQIKLVYRNGRRFTMDTSGNIVMDTISFTPDAHPEQWARWWLYYAWPTPQTPRKWGDGMKWGDGHVWGSDLTPQQVVDLRVIPRDWNAAHSFGRIVLQTSSGDVQLSLGDWNAA